MVNLKAIIEEIEELVNIRSLVGSYEEIASMKMRHIRGKVVSSRDFIKDLAEIYQELTSSYRNQILALLKEKKINKSKTLSVKNNNGKTACVFLSANSGLFGDILKRTFKEFTKYLEQHQVDPIIIGVFGKKYFMQQYPDRHFEYFPLSENDEQQNGLKNILEKFIEYENIIIFYARFDSMSSQHVAMLDVYGQQETTEAKSIPIVHYLFEPSLEKILEFFENQIFSSIIDQTFTESELARNAARMIALESATENIDDRLKSVDLQKRLAVHRTINKKQIESLAGMSLWGM